MTRSNDKLKVVIKARLLRPGVIQYLNRRSASEVRL